MPAGLGVWELVIILAVLLLLFGAKRLPEMGRSLGHGMREFKDAVTGNVEEPPKDEQLPARTRPAATSAPRTQSASTPAADTQPASTPAAEQPDEQSAETERVSS